MKAALYYREPLDDENTGYRLIEKALQLECEYKIFHDSVNGRQTRPVKSALLKRLRGNEFDTLIIDTFNSWAKNPTELIRELYELNGKGIMIITLFDKIQLCGSYFDSNNRVLRAFAIFEQRRLNEKASTAIQNVRRKGRFPGRPRGSKDRKKRETEGYFSREAIKRELKSNYLGDRISNLKMPT